MNVDEMINGIKINLAELTLMSVLRVVALILVGMIVVRLVLNLIDRMLEQGLLSEVEGLLRRGVSPTSTAMQAIGYKEIAAALRGECTMAEAVDTVKRESRRYAKRQLTWLRRDPGIHWLPREEYPDLPSLLAQISFVLRQEPT